MSGARASRVPADRRLLRGCVLAVAVAVVVAVVAGVFLLRGADESDAARERVSIEEAAAAAVGALMTFGPADGPADRAAVAERLTGVLAGDYLSRGPDLVFTGATASKVTMTATVIDAGVAESTEGRARTLVFVDQTIAVGDRGGEPERVAVSRWATMTEEDGRWLLARLDPVSPQ